MEILQNIADYNMNEWADATGLPGATMVPAAIGLFVAGLALYLGIDPMVDALSSHPGPTGGCGPPAV